MIDIEPLLANSFLRHAEHHPIIDSTQSRRESWRNFVKLICQHWWLPIRKPPAVDGDRIAGGLGKAAWRLAY